MIIKTKEFQEVANKILFAADVDKTTANVEINVTSDAIYLNATNKEYFVSVKFDVESREEFKAVVDASLFLGLISGLTTDTFELTLDGVVLYVIAGRSKYKIPLIYEGSELKVIKPIVVRNAATELVIDTSILNSIMEVNRRELLKVKGRKITEEVQKLYLIDETGCFTFTTGACFNAFTLEKPVAFLLNDKLVSLFKLFNQEKVMFRLGTEDIGNGLTLTKASFVSGNVYLAANITCDPALISTARSKRSATKQQIKAEYSHLLKISASKLLAGISRLILFTKNSVLHTNPFDIRAAVHIEGDKFCLTDISGNVEAIDLETDSVSPDELDFNINVIDLKSVLESCKNEVVTIKVDRATGKSKFMLVEHKNITNLIIPK